MEVTTARGEARARMVERLRKLKRLAEDQQGLPEGIAALAKIQALMGEYQVEISELAGAPPLGPDAVEARILWAGAVMPRWVLLLGNAAATHNRCRFVNVYSPYGEYVEGMGYGFPDDLDAVEAMFDAAMVLLDHLYPEYIRTRTFMHEAVELSYKCGFANGLHEVLKAQREQSSWALMVVTPEAVNERLAQEGFITAELPSVLQDARAAAVGHEEGRKFTTQRRVKES